MFRVTFLFLFFMMLISHAKSKNEARILDSLLPMNIYTKFNILNPCKDDLIQLIYIDHYFLTYLI